MSESDPLQLFTEWYQKAKALAIDKPHAMSLSTVDNNQRSSSRVVLLSSYDHRGFVFHSNYNSRKGKDIAQTSWGALLFWWDDLNYQIRIEGQINKTTAEESDDYFKHRPRGSQIGAWASDQSEPLNYRDELGGKFEEWQKKFADQAVARPPHWGGYRLVPQFMEFWIGREDRLHDRIAYTKEKNKWSTAHLSP